MKKILLFIPMLFSTVFCSQFARAENTDQTLLKVTIAVDGMMKSKSGAT